jgi:shikimate dehydrogenase
MTAVDAKLPHAEVIGTPIAHSKSPLIHGFWLERLHIPAHYEPCHVMPAELADYLGLRRTEREWRGCNVTIPHKEAAVLLVDVLDARASAVGAVNTILHQHDRTLLGTNTDVDGVAEAVAAGGWSRNETNGPAVVLGAGGAARAAFKFLAETGDEVRVLARDPAKARRAAADCGLSARIFPFAAASGAFAGASLLINATQLGMSGQQAMPGFVLDELAAMAPGGVVFDMVYAPLETKLLAAAHAAGLVPVDGLTMLIGQAATAFEKFFGRPPPRECDAELRALLTAA